MRYMYSVQKSGYTDFRLIHQVTELARGHSLAGRFRILIETLRAHSFGQNSKTSHLNSDLKTKKMIEN